MGEMKEFEDQFTFNLVILWHFNKDRSCIKMCADNGMINDQWATLEGKESTYLKRGCFMKKESVEILEAHLPSVLECCFFENPTTRKIITDFIDYVLADRKLEDYVREKLSDYPSLTYQMKISHSSYPSFHV